MKFCFSVIGLFHYLIKHLMCIRHCVAGTKNDENTEKGRLSLLGRINGDCRENAVIYLGHQG